MNEFIGKFISLNCETGDYQGQIKDVSSVEIILDKAFCNGRPCSSQPVIIPSKQIKSLKLLDVPTEPPPFTPPVRVERPLPLRHAAIQQNGRKPDTTRQSPRKAEMCLSPKKLDTAAARRDRRLRWVDKDEEAFGSPIDITLQPDFDFEKNLALFDKKAVYDEINASKPDLLRQVDKKANRYKCNENVLEQDTIRLRQITIPEPLEMEYATDSGLIVPAAPQNLRRQVTALADDAGLSFERQAELMGRATTELALQLLGGAHRLNPQNEHQCPLVAILAGCHRAGTLACNSARQLSAHGVRTVLYIKGDETNEMLRELRLLRQTDCILTKELQDLKDLPVDLIILALTDPSMQMAPTSSASQWAENSRAPVLALDPPMGGTRGLNAKVSLTAPLPLSYNTSNGNVYLCNLGIPKGVYEAAGVNYHSPFGAKFVISLHPNNA